MHPTKLKQLEDRLESQMPLIGGCVRQRVAQTLARDGSPDAVRILAKAIARSDDRQVLAIALDALRQIRKQQCIDEVCAVWAVTRHKDLANLLIKKSWVAFGPEDVKVLSALKAGQLEVVTKGGAEIVEPLLKAFSDADSEIASRASQCAIALKKLETQERLCRLVIEQDHQIARQVAINAQYAPRDPNQRALFYFLSEQWDKYESLDYEHTLLQTAYQVGDEQLRQRIAQKVRQAGRAEWVQIIAGGHKGKRLGEMTHNEWETALEILNSGRKWEEMWQLAQVAPPIWSVRLLRQLKNAKWVSAELVQMGQKCVADIALSSLWRCQATLHGHENLVNCISISPDGKLLASGSSDKTVRLWSLPDGKPLKTLTKHSDPITRLAISPDGKLLASGCLDPKVILWSLPDGKPLKVLTGSGPSGSVSSLGISPDGKLLASSYYNHINVALLSLPDGTLQTLTRHRNGVSSLAISPDGKLLASGSSDKTIRLWSLPGGKPLQTLTGYSDGVSSLTISPDGKLLASGSYDKTIRLWSLPSGKPLQTLTGHSGSVYRLGISPDSKLLSSVSDDKTIRLWSLPDGKLLHTLTEHSDRVNCISISPDGKLLASGSDDKTIRLWSLPGGKPLQTLTGHSNGVSSLAISPDGKLLVSGSSDNTVRLWTPGLYNLSRLPVEQISAEDMQWVQEALQEQAISEAERDWLKFIQALARWRRRFDVEVEEAPRKIDAGEFDIEIEG